MRGDPTVSARATTGSRRVRSTVSRSVSTTMMVTRARSRTCLTSATIGRSARNGYGFTARSMRVRTSVCLRRSTRRRYRWSSGTSCDSDAESILGQRALDAALEPARTGLAVVEAAMPAERRARDRQFRPRRQAIDVLDRQDRIVGRGDQPGVHVELAEDVTDQGVALEVVLDR